MSDSPQHIVVGFDGSRDAGVALDWAARLVKTTGTRLHVVGAWEGPVVLGAPVTLTRCDPRDHVADAIRAALEFRGIDPDGPDVKVIVRRGYAGHALVEASAEADLLVVGRRGTRLGRFLGSVSNYCVTEASCPVCVVPSA